MSNIQDLAIIGAGPAGMTAAIYIARTGKSVTLFEKLAPGGQAALTNSIDNYPGFEEGINGFELTDKIRQQGERFGAVFEYDSVESFSYNKTDKVYTLTTGVGNTFTAKTVLVATGTTPRRLGIPGEDKYFGHGIGTCAICDGAFYKEKEVAVIGGGNSALEESLYLANIASTVYIIHRRDEFRGDHYVQEKVKNHPKIQLILDSVVEEFQGDQKLTHCLIKNVKTNENTLLKVDGVFLYVGLDANTDCLDDQYKDKTGFVLVNKHHEVNQEGLFAAGDCCLGTEKQVVIACGHGAEVSYRITHYLSLLS